MRIIWFLIFLMFVGIVGIFAFENSEPVPDQLFGSEAVLAQHSFAHVRTHCRNLCARNAHRLDCDRIPKTDCSACG